MGIELYLAAAVILAALVFLFLAWRTVVQHKSASTSVSGTENLLVELARLQERERNFAEDASRMRSNSGQLETELNSLRQTHSETRERLAGAEERTLTLQQTVERLTGELSGARSALDGLQISLAEASQHLASSQTAERELRARIDRAEGYIVERDQKISGLERILEEFRGKSEQKERDLAALLERHASLEKNMEDKKQELTELQQRLKTEFQNIANTVLTNATERLTVTSGETLSNILKPLKERIEQFQNRIDTVHQEETVQRTALSGEIQRLAEAAGNLGQEADEFAKALKGDSGLRGQWGEERLERILEMSGLERDREYVVQGGDFNIKSEEGRNQRPDFIILLPEARHFVIDSKVSLIDYLDYETAESDESRADALKKLTASCRKHVEDLAGKEYQHGDSINSHDLVLMFMPIEGAVALVLKDDPKLFEYAWKRRILIVSPGTLFLAMRTVSSIWKYERQNQNAKAIAAQAGKLFDKLVGFVDDLNDVSKKLHDAWVTHNSAMGKLAVGRGNALSRAQKLRALGVDSKKTFPMILIDGEKQPIEDDDEEIAQESRVPQLIPPPNT